MIAVQLQPEPQNFALKVKNGRDYLASNSSPTSDEIRNRDYWTYAFIDLWTAYKGICAYSATWVPGTGSCVDHFKPITQAPKLAYKWSNYRLASSRLNSRKSDFSDVLDPFLIGPNWFVIDFSTMLIWPGPTVSIYQKRRIEKTISRLKLNDDDILITNRYYWVKQYRDDDSFTLNKFKRWAPFIAYELKRQGLTNKRKLRQVVK